MPYDWNNPYDSVIAYDVGNPQTIDIPFGVTSTEGLSSVAVTRGPINRSVPIGIPSKSAFGSITVTLPSFFVVSGVATAEFISGISPIVPFFLDVSGIQSLETFGPCESGQSAPIPHLVQSARNFSINGSIASIAFSTSNVSQGNTIIFAAAIALPANILSVTDSAGNQYVQSITNIDISGGSTVTIWSSTVTQGAGTKPDLSIHTSGSGLVYAFLWEFSGINILSPIDVPPVSSDQGSAGINVSSGPVLTRYINDVLVGICICGTTVTSATTGWTSQVGASNPRVFSEVLVALAPGVYSADFTQTSASIYNAVLASFRSAVLLPVRASRIL